MRPGGPHADTRASHRSPWTLEQEARNPRQPPRAPPAATPTEPTTAHPTGARSDPTRAERRPTSLTGATPAPAPGRGPCASHTPSAPRTHRGTCVRVADPVCEPAGNGGGPHPHGCGPPDTSAQRRRAFTF